MKKKIVLYDINEIKTYGNITNEKISLKGKFTKDGLFSEQIFGPIEDYKCQCGNYNIYGGRCEKCGVEFISSDERGKRFAEIKLPYKIIHPIFLWMNRESKNNKIVYDLIKFRYYLVLLDEYNYELLPIDEDMKNFDVSDNKFIGANALEKLFEIMEYEEKEYGKSYKSIKIFNQWKKYKKIFFLNRILVLPPDLRPIIFLRNKEMLFSDKINRDYLRLINKINTITGRKFIDEINLVNIQNLKTLQEICNDIYSNIFEVFGGKTGIFRGNILGKRVDFSGRAVIVPDPILKMDEVRISYYILLEIFKFEVIRKITIEQNELFFQVLEEIEDELIMKDYKFKFIDELEEIVKDKIVMLNRQPTLHKHSMLSFKILIGKDETISIHPLICSCYNADFDGDQMAVYFPITIEGIEDAKKMLPSRNLFLEGNDELAYVPSQDIVYGIYIASKQPNYEEILPKPLVAYMKAKKLNKITKDDLILFLNKYIRKTKDVSILDEIKDIGFLFSSTVEIDISLEALKKANITKEEKDRLIKAYKNGGISEYQKIEKEIIKNVVKRCSFSDIILSGSRGSLDQLKQMFIGKGYIADASNNILEKPIITSFVDGLNSEELFLSSYGVRKGLADVADSTARSGVFCRSLVYLAINSEREKDKNKDCHPKKYLKFKIEKDNFKLARALINRYVAFNEKDFKDENYLFVTLDNAHLLLGKEIYLRSPIFCKHEKFCYKCCPTNDTNLAVGINAALSLGERSTQLVLRTFHTSGVVTSSQKSNSSKNKDITSDLSLVTKMFNNPQDYIDNSIESLILSMFDIFKNYGTLNLINFEILISNLMWINKNEDDEEIKKLWRLYQDGNIEWVGMSRVPQLYSFLVAAAFGHFKQRIFSSLGQTVGNTIFDKILLGQF